MIRISTIHITLGPFFVKLLERAIPSSPVMNWIVQDQQRELSSDGGAGFNPKLKTNRVLIFKFNSTHEYHMNPYTWNVSHATYYFFQIIGTNMKFNNTNSATNSPRHSHCLFTSVSNCAIVDHAFIHWAEAKQKSLTRYHSKRAGPVRSYDELARQEVKRQRECPEALWIF